MIVFADLDPRLPGYMGPADIYKRYMAGEVVTKTDCLSSNAEWVIIPAMPWRDQERLHWMLKNLERVDGEATRIR